MAVLSRCMQLLSCELLSLLSSLAGDTWQGKNLSLYLLLHHLAHT